MRRLLWELHKDQIEFHVIEGIKIYVVEFRIVEECIEVDREKREERLNEIFSRIEMVHFIDYGIIREVEEEGVVRVKVILGVRSLIGENPNLDICISYVVKKQIVRVYLKKPFEEIINGVECRREKELNEIKEEWKEIYEKSGKDEKGYITYYSGMMGDVKAEVIEYYLYRGDYDEVDEWFPESYMNKAKCNDIRGAESQEISEIEQCMVLITAYMQVKGYKIQSEDDVSFVGYGSEEIKEEEIEKEISDLNEVSRSLKIRFGMQLDGINVKEKLYRNRDEIKKRIREGWFKRTSMYININIIRIGSE